MVVIRHRQEVVFRNQRTPISVWISPARKIVQQGGCGALGLIDKVSDMPILATLWIG